MESFISFTYAEYDKRCLNERCLRVLVQALVISAGEVKSMISRVTECIADIDLWMSSNRLKLNS